jgi:hypothetical protein
MMHATARDDDEPGNGRPWTLRIAWVLFSLAAPLLAASAFFLFEAERGVKHGFAFELVLATVFGLLIPLAVVAIARRRNAWSGPSSRLFCMAAFAIAALFFVLAGFAS